MITLNDCMTIPDAADRYGVSLNRVRARVKKIKENPELLEKLVASEVIKLSGSTWLVTTELMDDWFGKKEEPGHIFPRKVREYVRDLSDLEELAKLKHLIERRELEFKASADFAAQLSLKLNIPYHVASGFVQLADAIDVSVAALQIKNWKGKRLYYKDPRRSRSAHQDGQFYYCLISKRFVEPYRDEEGLFGIAEHDLS